MSNEVILARIDGFVEELKELGVTDIVVAAGNDEGFFSVKYSGDYRGISYLAMSSLMNIMFDSMQEIALEMKEDGRENYR
jgi:hypothetical protein|tara:strand:- start:1126 stop:1365 length:240 start_codon:yes stop_codon:yes gene_type:complete